MYHFPFLEETSRDRLVSQKYMTNSIILKAVSPFEKEWQDRIFVPLKI